jgi:hypothetical protein
MITTPSVSGEPGQAPAVRRMSNLPCDKLRLEDRGQVRLGAYSDFAIFDPEKVSDTATYDQPATLPRNASRADQRRARASRQPTEALAGRALRRSGVAGRGHARGYAPHMKLVRTCPGTATCVDAMRRPVHAGPGTAGSPRRHHRFGTSSKSHQKRQASVPRRSDTAADVRWGTSSTTRGFPREPESLSSPGQASDLAQRSQVQILPPLRISGSENVVCPHRRA